MIFQHLDEAVDSSCQINKEKAFIIMYYAGYDGDCFPFLNGLCQSTRVTCVLNGVPSLVGRNGASGLERSSPG